MNKTPEQIFDWLNANGQADIVEYITQLHNQIKSPQTKPLSDEEILKLQWMVNYASADELVDFARTIEERHGIK